MFFFLPRHSKVKIFGIFEASVLRPYRKAIHVKVPRKACDSQQDRPNKAQRGKEKTTWAATVPHQESKTWQKPEK